MISYFKTGSTSFTPQTHSNLVPRNLLYVLQAEQASKYHPNLKALNRLVVPLVVAKQPYIDIIVYQQVYE